MKLVYPTLKNEKKAYQSHEQPKKAWTYQSDSAILQFGSSKRCTAMDFKYRPYNEEFAPILPFIHPYWSRKLWR